MRAKFFFLLILLLSSSIIRADLTPVLQRTGKTFDPAIPTVQSVLGYDFGERITRHADMEKYMTALSTSVPNIKMTKIGETWEGRSLYYVIISSPENMARLEELRQANLRLADPRKISGSDADQIISKNPVFVGLTYSVHGDEHSGVEAGMAMAYYLLACRDAETTELLKNTVVIIDPMQNPDGRERFINYFYQTVGIKPNPDTNAAEHNEAWPEGRYNHYLFDMNRDWTIVTQPETKARIAAYQQYQPEVYIDAHEMGENSNYFFPPPSTPRNPNVPASQVEWWKILGHSIAADFDKNHIDYFTEENFDFWYPGYGDSWPTYNGAIAGTFEQGSTRGMVVKRRDGITIDYKDAIYHHFVSSLATVKMSSSHRSDKLRDFYNYRATAVQEGKTGAAKEYILSRASDPQEADHLVKQLLIQGIEVRQATADFSLAAHDYLNDSAQNITVKQGDYILSLDQPLKRMINVSFEKAPAFDKKFLDEESKRRLNHEPTEIYDITAWALPMAFNLKAYWSGDALKSSTQVVTQVASAINVPNSSFGYVLNYNTNDAIAAIYKLLDQNVRVYFSRKPFVLAGKSYLTGSFIIKTKDNPDNLHDIIQKAAQETGVSFDPASTGWTEEGPDFGSNDVRPIKTPSVAVITYLPTEPTSYGAIAYLMDRRYGIPYTAIQAYSVSDFDLRPYNVIVIPDGGSWGSYNDIIGSGGFDKLKAWVQSGGTLIAIGGGASYLADHGDIVAVKRIKKYYKDSTEVPDSDDKTKKDERETESPTSVPGSIARVKLNLKDFLTYGYSSEDLPVFVQSNLVFDMPKGTRPSAAYAGADQFKLAGLFWDIDTKRLAGKMYATQERIGSGRVILFAEDPNFRAYWDGLGKLFLNGILFGPSM